MIPQLGALLQSCQICPDDGVSAKLSGRFKKWQNGVVESFNKTVNECKIPTLLLAISKVATGAKVTGCRIPHLPRLRFNVRNALVLECR